MIGGRRKIASATVQRDFAAVSLYELVLRYPDREEVRLTDQPVAVGDTFEIDYEEWFVVEENEPENRRATARFLCERTKEQRALAAKMQADDAQRRVRIQRLEQRAAAQRKRLDGGTDETHLGRSPPRASEMKPSTT